jgi:hypothetical protein
MCRKPIYFKKSCTVVGTNVVLSDILYINKEEENYEMGYIIVSLWMSTEGPADYTDIRLMNMSWLIRRL